MERQRLLMEARPSFDQYVALEHAIEDAGGATHMFHPTLLVPKSYHAVIGIRNHSPETTERLEQALKAVPGVRSVFVDPERWFTNEQGIDVGGTVLFADPSPKLTWNLEQAALRAGFRWENKEHGEGENVAKEWSEMNHAFSGLCLLVLSVVGMLQIGLSRPPNFVRYGSVAVWFALFVFLFIRADRSSWPLGPVSWWDGFKEWETFQHRIGIGLILGIAVADYFRIRGGWKVPPLLGRWGLLLGGIAGSTMLYTHLHQTLDPAHLKMVARMNAQHVAMATAALGFTVTKFAWDTWQAPKRVGAYLPLVCLAILGIILNLYVE